MAENCLVDITAQELGKFAEQLYQNHLQVTGL